MGYGEPSGLKSACLRSWEPSIELCFSDRSCSRIHADSRRRTWSIRVSASMHVSFTLPDAGRAGAGTIF